MDWTQSITLGIAVIGATLGVFNAYWMVRRDTVRLRVRFMSMYIPGMDTWTTGVEVTNLGYMAVSITEVAFLGGSLGSKRVIIPDDYLRRHRLPLRLEPRAQVTIAGEPSLVADIRQCGATHCSASTACGLVVKARIRRQRR